MKIIATCMECLKEFGHQSVELIVADYFETAVVNVECNRGHRSAHTLQSQKFEVLLESAANALLEGYTLESASSFSSAYERFLEFCLQVLCNKRGIAESEFEQTFNQVSRQSERQVGAFLFLHLLEFGNTYKINDKIKEFRNKVVHKGYIPTPEEVEGFGKNVYDEVYSLTQLLKKSCSESIRKVIATDLRHKNLSLPSGMPRATSSGAMFFSLSNGEQKNSFNEALGSYKEWRIKLLGAIPRTSISENGL